MTIENNILADVEDSDIENGTFIVPDNIIRIENFAFNDCSSLKTIKIPENVIKIGNYAFRKCNHLKTIKISENIMEIGLGTFEDCSSLKTIKIPKNVIKIGNYAFENCHSLKTITILENVTKIGSYAFYNCDLQSKKGNYKAFNKGLQCKSMQYNPYQWNEIGGKIRMCKNGLHYVTNLFDIFNYYRGNLEEDIEVWEIEPGNIIVDNVDDSKKTTNKIKPIKKLSRLEIINILNNK